MKKLIFVALTLLLSVSLEDVSAQGFLKNVSKAIKKEVVNRVNRGSKNNSTEKQTNNNTEKQENNTAETQTTEQSQQATNNKQQTTKNTVQSQFRVNESRSVQTIAALVPYGPTTGKVNGHEWVDMGLPSGTRWATCNVDALAPEQPGKHYAWGETATKTSYTQANSKHYGKSVDDISGNKLYDVATAKWGAGWRMPTNEEFSELAFYCGWRYVQKKGRWGVEFTSNKNNNSIFLPATGSKDGTSLHEASGCGMYWTSTPYKDGYNNGAHEYHFGGALGEMGIAERYYGYAVRPVTSYNVNTETPSSGKINGHKWVDLGLPSGLKWATCNLGADAVDQDGGHYAWGEITLHIDKSSRKNKLYGKKSGDIAGNAQYDAARALWGGTWRLPTEDDFKELVDNCTFEWTTVGRRDGLKVTSKINGNYIFLPASGNIRSLSSTYGRANDINKNANYWTSTPARSSYSNDAYAFIFSNTRFIMQANTRAYGYSIRPVSE